MRVKLEAMQGFITWVSILIKKVYNHKQVCGIHKENVTETKQVNQAKEDDTTEQNE
jgi:hypothetical protein